MAIAFEPNKTAKQADDAVRDLMARKAQALVDDGRVNEARVFMAETAKERDRLAAREARKLRKMDRTAKAIADPEEGWVENRAAQLVNTMEAQSRTLVSIRLDPEVIAFFKALGPNYTTKINEVLVKVVREGAERWLGR